MDASVIPTGIDPARFLTGRREGHTVALGISYVAHGPSWCELALDYDRRLISDLTTGILASGPIVSLLDMAAGLAVALARGDAFPSPTLDLRVDYLRPARPGVRVIGRAECYRLARKVAFVSGIAHDGDAEDPIAHLAGTYALDPGALR